MRCFDLGFTAGLGSVVVPSSAFGDSYSGRGGLRSSFRSPGHLGYVSRKSPLWLGSSHFEVSVCSCFRSAMWSLSKVQCS